jgi:hypothetical protein
MGQSTLFDFDFDRLPLGPFDSGWWWLLVGVAVALLFSLQAMETAIEGTWPHQRRDNEYIPGARGIKPAWGIAAVLVIPGALAVLGIIAVILWLDIRAPEGLNLGGALLGLGWILFLAFGLNVLGLGRLLGTLGMFGPLAIAIVLLVADGLLIVTLLDVLPAWDVVQESLKNGLEDMLPFIEFDDESARSLSDLMRV